MAAYTPNDAIALARKYCRDIPVTSIDSQVCDIINSRIWFYYPWKWTQGALNAISLINAQQDYSITNTDFSRLLRARLVKTPTFYGPPLDILNSLEPTTCQVGFLSIESIAYEPVTSKLRLEYPVSLGSGEVVAIVGEYQKKPTKIEDAQLGTAFSFPDHYFQVFMEGLKWKLYEFEGSPKAGSVVVARDGRKSYSGQLGVFMESLQEMAAAEDYSAEETLVPETPMGSRGC